MLHLVAKMVGVVGRWFLGGQSFLCTILGRIRKSSIFARSDDDDDDDDDDGDGDGDGDESW